MRREVIGSHVNRPVVSGNWNFPLKGWTLRESCYSHRHMIPMNVGQIASKKHSMKVDCPGRSKAWKSTFIEQQVQNRYHKLWS